MAADKAPPDRAFVTAAQSLQHLATNARLGDAQHEGGMSRAATSSAVYQQAPRGDDDRREAASREDRVTTQPEA